MAIAPTTPPWNTGILYDEENVNYAEYAIGGKLITAQLNIQDSEAILLEDDPKYKDTLKMKLLSMLVEYIMDNKLVEFTQYQDVSTMARTIYARCYIAPDSQVKILKINTLKK